MDKHAELNVKASISIGLGPDEQFRVERDGRRAISVKTIKLQPDRAVLFGRLVAEGRSGGGQIRAQVPVLIPSPMWDTMPPWLHAEHAKLIGAQKVLTKQINENLPPPPESLRRDRADHRGRQPNLDAELPAWRDSVAKDTPR